MRNQFALLLALPASILLTAGLSSQQSYQAAPLKTAVEHDQVQAPRAITPSVISTNLIALKVPDIGPIVSCSAPYTQLAAVTLGPVPTLVPKVNHSAVPAIFQPALVHSSEVKNSVKQMPSITTVHPNVSLVAPVLKAPLSPNQSGAAGSKATSTKGLKATTPLPAKPSDEDEIKYVALTFDDGPNPIYTPQILALLKKEGIHATFCVIGREAKRYPEIIQQIVAEGHKLANHTMNHDEYLEKRSLKKIKEEILGNNALLETIVPGTPIDYYRAPGGNSDRRLRKLVRSWGMEPLGWSVDTKDWQRPGVNEILFAVKIELHNGGVVLMHDGGGDRSDTVAALKKLLPKLKKEGYQFVFPG